MTPQELNVIIALRKMMEELAYNSVERPSADPFITGLQAGKYHGLKAAIDEIEKQHKAVEDDEEDKSKV